MASIHVDIGDVEWTSGVPFYGPDAVYDGKDLVRLKILSRSAARGRRHLLDRAGSCRRRAS